MPTLQDLLAEAQHARQAGDLDRSEALCRHILADATECGPAWHLLGSICYSRGRSQDALDCHFKAARLLPDLADAHYDLGHACHVLGRLSEAAAGYRRALDLAPAHYAARANLGTVFHQQGQLEEALACYRHVLEHQPELA